MAAFRLLVILAYGRWSLKSAGIPTMCRSDARLRGSAEGAGSRHRATKVASCAVAEHAIHMRENLAAGDVAAWRSCYIVSGASRGDQ